MNAALGAAADGLRIEEQQIGPRAGHEPAAVLDAIGPRDVVRHALDRLGQGEVAALADPVTEEMQPEGGVAEEGQVGAGVGERHRRVRMTEELLDLALVGVEELAVEHRVELAVEAEVEEDVQRIAPGLAGEVGHAATDEARVLWAGDLQDPQVRPRLVAEAVRHARHRRFVLDPLAK